MRIFLLGLLVLAAAQVAYSYASSNTFFSPRLIQTGAKPGRSAKIWMKSTDRRDAMKIGAKVIFGSASSLCFGGFNTAEAAAGGDIFTAQLHNRYFLVRSGENAWESEGSSLITNPVFKLHQEKNGLSPVGYDQAKRAAEELKQAGFGAASECWVWTSTHASSYQTAEIISDEFLIPYSHIIPEFSFLDQRGYGLFEGTNVAKARQTVWKYDAQDPDYRMPPNTDGTPNESLRDVQVRVKQALQIMETQYSDLDIAIVGPDSETLSALHCSLEGAPLNLAHQFAFGPGDVRLMDFRNRKEEIDLAFNKLDQPLTGVTHKTLRVNNILFKGGPEAFLHPKP